MTLADDHARTFVILDKVLYIRVPTH